MAVQDEFHENISEALEVNQQQMRKKAEIGLRHILYYNIKNKELLKNQYHNTDFIEPFAKKKE